MKQLNADNGSDPLGDVLNAVRFRSTIFCRSDMTAPWGFAVDGRDFATFHFVERGSSILDVQGAGPSLVLEPGDLVILPHGHAHAMRDAPDSPVTGLTELLSAHEVSTGGELHFGGGGAPTSLVCGGFEFENRDLLPF